MRSEQLRWYRLRWPREVDLQRLRALSHLLATSGGAPIVVESVGRSGAVEQRLGLPRASAEGVTEQMQGALHGLGLVEIGSRAVIKGGRTLEFRLTTPLRPLRIDQSELVGRAVLTALGLTRPGEELLLQWQLLTALPPASIGGTPERPEALPASIADVLMGRRGRLDADSRRALRLKRELPVWRAVGRVAVRAASANRERALLRELVNALRLADAPGVRLTARRSAASVERIGRSWFAPLRLNTAELVAVAGWPVGPIGGLPIEQSGSRPLAPSKKIATRGCVLGTSTFPGAERPVALSVEDGLRHMHVLGPTGTGKSTLLLNAIVQHLQAGRGVVVIEPKGDLIKDVLARIPPGRLDDVVLLDPTDEQQSVGLNPLASSGRPAELVADQLLGMFRSMYESSWGPRTNDILGASLLTLARTPGMTLCALPVLLGDPSFRRRVVAGLDDPIALGSFWLAYESWSEAERAAAIAPVLNKVRPFILRPQLRAILGQSQPRFDLSQVFSERQVLLVNLAKGQIGGEAAALLGSLTLAQLWAAALRRTLIPAQRRSPAFVFIDEVQDYLHLPTDLGDALVQARGLGVGFVLANQHLNQFGASMRSAVLANARSKICFQLAAEDARALANGALTSDDFRELAAFEVYAQLVAGGAVQPWCSARTLPPPPVSSDPAAVRTASRIRYGVDRRTVDAEIEQLAHGRRADGDDLSPRRRAGGDAL